MRNALLTITILFYLAAVSTAAGQKKSAQAQPRQTQQTQVARNDTMGPAFAPPAFNWTGAQVLQSFYTPYLAEESKWLQQPGASHEIQH